MTTSRRYRFAEFVLSPRRRVLWRHGEPLAIIPKYFDLLLFLVEHRRDAVSKQTIFSRVWSEVIVSDGALSQAVRVLRRTLGDDAREPRFIRTVPRHGYQFVWTETVEEVDDGTAGRGEIPGTETGAPVGTAPPPTTATRLDAAPVPTLDALVDELIALAATDRGGDQARDLAERLHARGTAEALAILRARPGHSSALALMRDARWTIPGAGPVPLLTEPGGPAAAAALIRLRLGDAGRIVSARWAGAAWAGTIGGAMAGTLGGVALLVSPTSNSQPQVIVALAVLGAVAGAIGAAGIGAGLAAAEALARSRRPLALALCGAAAGTAIGGTAHLVARALLESLFGMSPWPDGGGMVQGLVLGAASGVAYGWATPQPPGGGLAAPRGRRRVAVAGVVGLGCALAATALSRLGYPMVGGLVHDVARLVPSAQLVLAPLGHLVGEPGFGGLTQTLLAAFEGGAFGIALAWGLTRSPRMARELNS